MPRSLESFLWNNIWAKDCRYPHKKNRLNLASTRFYTTSLLSKSLSSDRESREESLREINTTHRSSIRMLSKNTPPLNPLAKSLWALNSQSKTGKSSVGTEKHRKLPKRGPKRWKWLPGRLLNSRESKLIKKAESPELGPETAISRASSMVMSLPSRVGGLPTLWIA